VPVPGECDNVLISRCANFVFSLAQLSDQLIIKYDIMNKIALYIRDSYKELMHKVTWPTWAELQQSTMIVLVATIIITAIVALMDFVSNGVLKFVYSLFK